MLSGYQCEVVAFFHDGYLCRACAVSETSTVTVDKAERGLTNAYGLLGIIRFSLDEINGERAFEEAQERADRFQREHPALYEALVRDHWRLMDRIAERIGDRYDATCDNCGEVL